MSERKCETCIHYHVCLNHEECGYYEPDRPRGEWIFTGRHNAYGGTEIECSNCHNKLMVSMSRWEVGENFCDICGSQNKKGKDELNLDSYSWVETDEFINEIGADLNGW